MNKKNTQKELRQNRHGNFFNGIIWSGNPISFNVTNTLFVTYLAFYATDVLGLKAGIFATVLLLTKCFDGITDLIAGFIVDNTHSRWGKGRPYDWCIPLAAIFTTLTFATPVNAPQIIKAVYLGVMYVLTMAVCETLLGASEPVYMLRAFPEEEQRNSVFNVSMIFSQIVNFIVGIILPVAIAQIGTSGKVWTRMVFLIAVPVSFIAMVRFFMIQEPTAAGKQESDQKTEKTEKDSVSLKAGIHAVISNRYVMILTVAIFIIVIASGFMNAVGTYYFQYFVGDLTLMALVSASSLASLAMLFLFMPLSKKIGKDMVMKSGLVISVIGSVIRIIGGVNIVSLCVGNALLMFGIMPVAVYTQLYLYDIMDYGEWENGQRVEGVLAVIPNFANKVAAGISTSLAMYILAAVGYDGSAKTQSAFVMSTINMTYMIIPAVLIGVMGLIIILFYDLDKKMPQIRKDLEERHAAMEDAKNV